MRGAAVFLLLLWPAPAWAGWSIEPDPVPVGGRVTLRYDIALKDGERASLPAAPALPDGVDLVSAVVSDPVAHEGAISQTLTITADVYKLGKVEIPPLPYRITHKAGADSDAVTESMSIEAAAMLGPDDKPADIRPPEPVKPRPSRFILPALTLAALLTAAWLLYRWNKRRAPAAPISYTPPPPPAHETALLALSALEKEGLMERGMAREHFSRVSEIVRAYIEARWGILALERTTAELRAQFSPGEVEPGGRDTLFNLLAACDLVKFAKHAPTNENAREAVIRAREWIRATRETRIP
ncbi:MAG: hypothetical protein HY804_02195 [Nitrospinae bacterium]|nr:hypothetical protein [Nitrospinota bacterium]